MLYLDGNAKLDGKILNSVFYMIIFQSVKYVQYRLQRSQGCETVVMVLNHCTPATEFIKIGRLLLTSLCLIVIVF